MANYGPYGTFLVVGAKNISPETWQLDDSHEHVTEMVRGFSESWDRFKPVGHSRVQLEASGGLYDDVTNGIVSALQAMGQTRQMLVWGFSEMIAGRLCRIADGTYAVTWKRIAKLEELTKAHALHRITGQAHEAVILNALARSTDPWNTEGASFDNSLNPLLTPIPITVSTAANDQITTAVPHGLTTGDVVIIAGHAGSTPSINGQATVTVVDPTNFTIGVNITVGGTGGTVTEVTSNGFVADMHVLALTLGGFTNVIIKVRHSPDNAVFSDLCTFTTVTAAPFANRQTGATLVQRYRAVSGDFTGAGSGQSVTALVALA